MFFDTVVLVVAVVVDDDNNGNCDHDYGSDGVIAELHARREARSAARGRSPIAKEIYLSQKFW